MALGVRNGAALSSLAVLLVSGCAKSPTSPTTASPAATYSATTLSFTSDADDYVGQGRSQIFTLQNAVFSATTGNGESLSVVIRPFASETSVWGFTVRAPSGTKIAPGIYQTTRDGSGGWAADFFGAGRGCGRNTGRIVVHSFDYIPVNSALRNFRASFEQHCEGAAPALRVEVALLADPWR